MKAIITILFCLAVISCAGQSLNKTNYIIPDGVTYAGALMFSADSQSITLNAGSVRIDGRPMVIVPKMTNAGLVVDIYFLNENDEVPNKANIVGENF